MLVMCCLGLQVCRELEGTKARLEEELLGTAQLVTKLEGRVRETTARADGAAAAAEMANARVVAAEAAVAAEVRGLVCHRLHCSITTEIAAKWSCDFSFPPSVTCSASVWSLLH